MKSKILLEKAVSSIQILFILSFGTGYSQVPATIKKVLELEGMVHIYEKKKTTPFLANGSLRTKQLGYCSKMAGR